MAGDCRKADMNKLGELCTVITGFAPWFVGLLALLNDGNWIGAGVCLTVAAIAIQQTSLPLRKFNGRVPYELRGRTEGSEIGAFRHRELVVRRLLRRRIGKATARPIFERRRRKFVLQFQGVTIDTANGLHERATTINAGSVRCGLFLFGSVFNKEFGQFLRLFERQPEIGHANPRVVRFGFAQELDEPFRGEFLADVLQRNPVRLLPGDRMAGVAVQALEQRPRRRFTLARRPLILWQTDFSAGFE